MTTESNSNLSSKDGKSPKLCINGSPVPGVSLSGYLKMMVIEDLRNETIDEVVRELASDVQAIDTDATLKEYIPRYESQVIPSDKIGEILLWGAHRYQQRQATVNKYIP